MALGLAVLLGGCATSGPPGSSVSDPYEQTNRNVHAFNKGVDRAVLRPVSQGYGRAVPSPVRSGVSNFANNLSVPGQVVNSILQGRIEDSVHSTFRFLVNTTVGVAGIFDPATSFQLEERDADFGQTLAVWGVGSGAYLSVPLYGPSTQRDLTGDVVDLFTNPVGQLLTAQQRLYRTGTQVGDFVNERYVFTETYDFGLVRQRRQLRADPPGLSGQPALRSRPGCRRRDN